MKFFKIAAFYSFADLSNLKELQEIELAKKDPRRFGVLYDRYHEQIFRYLYARVDNKHLASDLVSSLCVHLTSEMPVLLKRNTKNLVEFICWLEEDQQALFSKNLNLDEAAPNYAEWKAYKKGLMLKLQSNEKFTEVLERLQELRMGM